MSTQQTIVRYAGALAVAIALIAAAAPSGALAAGPNVGASDTSVRGDAAEFVGEIVVGSLETAAAVTDFGFDIVQVASN